MLADNPTRWTDPSTWPWFVYVWVLFIVAGWAKPLWRWLQSRKAQSWPSTQGRIESVAVKPKKQFLVSTTPIGRAQAYIGDVAYSYSVEGQFYAGHYQREFGSEEEGWEFVRDLQGKPVIVSFNPSKPASSTITKAAIETLLNTRPPAPEAMPFEPVVSKLPSWLKPLLWPFVILLAVGLVVSLWVHLGALGGQKVAPEAFFWMLHVGIFVVWIPAVFVATKRVGNLNRKDFWRVVLKGSPDWMRYMVYCFLAYAMVNFLVFWAQSLSSSAKGETPVAMWRGFSGHWMAFYSAALAILYSAAAAPDKSSFEPPQLKP